MKTAPSNTVAALRRVSPPTRERWLAILAMAERIVQRSLSFVTAARKRRLHDPSIRLFHATSGEAATQIGRDGFEDRTGYYLTDTTWTGVWVSDVPLDENDFDIKPSPTDAYFAIDADEARIAEFEWIEEGKTYREWLIPAVLLNTFPRTRLTDQEVDEAWGARWARYWDAAENRSED